MFTPVLPQLFPQTTQNYPKNLEMLWKEALQLPLKKDLEALYLYLFKGGTRI